MPVRKENKGKGAIRRDSVFWGNHPIEILYNRKSSGENSGESNKKVMEKITIRHLGITIRVVIVGKGGKSIYAGGIGRKGW